MLSKTKPNFNIKANIYDPYFHIIRKGYLSQYSCLLHAFRIVTNMINRMEKLNDPQA